MIMNPAGYRTLYERSECFQNLAVLMADPSLCDLAIEHKSLFFDGSAISPAACRRRVAKQVEDDRSEIAKIRPQTLTELQGRLSGNGRDLDLSVGLSGGSAALYRMVVAAEQPRAVLLIDRPQPVGGEAGTLSALIRRSALNEALGGDAGEFRLRVTFTLEPRTLQEQRVYAALDWPGQSTRWLSCFVGADAIICRPETVKNRAP